MFRLVPVEVPSSKINWTAHPAVVLTPQVNTVCVSQGFFLPRSSFVEPVCKMVKERWRLSLVMCVKRWERRSNLNVKERLWVMTKWRLSAAWDCVLKPSEHRMLERRRRWFRLNYLSDYQTDWREICADIRFSQRMNPTDFTFTATTRSTFVVFSEMCWHLLD